jgi:hypothetical protein
MQKTSIESDDFNGKGRQRNLSLIIRKVRTATLGLKLRTESDPTQSFSNGFAWKFSLFASSEQRQKCQLKFSLAPVTAEIRIESGEKMFNDTFSFN